MEFDPSNVADVLRMTGLQQGMLFHCLVDEGSALYAAQYEWDLPDRLDLAAFGAAWRTVIARHAALRSSFEWEGVPQPVQIVWRAVDFDIEVRDLSDLAEAEREAALAEIRRTDLGAVGDLGAPPLCRVTVCRRGDASALVVWSFHQLLFDGWSIQVVLAEVASAYAALRAARPVSLAPAPQYQDYLRWISRRTTRGSAEFWREALAGFTIHPLLGRSGTRRLVSDQFREVTIDDGLYQAVRRCAASSQVTLYTVVSAVFGLIVGTWSGTRDVVFGASTADRPAELSGAARIVGPLLNTVPVRVRLDPSLEVRTWLRRSQAEQSEAREHAHCALTDIQRWIGAAQGVPLFDALLAFENYPMARPDGTGAARRHVAYRTRANYPLVFIVEAGPSLKIKINYSSQLFDEPTIDRLTGTFLAGLTAFAGDARQRLGDLDLLGADERRRLLTEVNNTAYDVPAESVVRLVERQVARVPDRTAVVCGPERLSFAELSADANRLAHHLRELGVGPGRTVGVCLERGPAAVVAFLGILKAGGAYLPMDPDFPPSRLGFLRSDAGASVVVTRAALADRVAGDTVRPVLVDADREIIARRPAGDPGPDAGPEEIAYLIYTSGSTGEPKGVEVTHRGLTNYVAWWVRQLEEAGAGGASHHTLAADTSVRDTFVPLAAGQTVHIVPEREGNTLDIVPGLLGPGQRLSYLRMTPSQLAAEMAEHTAADVAALTSILAVAGEAFPNNALAARLADVPGMRLANHYGPTETTIGATHAWIDGDISAYGEVLPIGRPIANTRVYVVDDAGGPVPAGVPGELWIGGPGVARGYRGRPGLTAQRFVPDGFSGTPGARLYRTGDLVRWRADGLLEFLGRLDQQVQVRGYRVEPGEVEAVLAACPAVASSAVVARTDPAGGRRLVAFLVAAGEPADPAQIREFLAARLPGYLVPSLFVTVAELPLMANGKVDRAALESVPLEQESAGRAEDYVAPRDPVEEVIAGIWAELLGVEPVGAFDDFFARGGHSLMVTRLVSRLRDAFDVEVRFSAVFAAPTVADLATVVRELQGTKGGVLPAVVPVPRAGELPLSFSQQRLRFLDQLVPDNPFYNMPFSYRIRSGLDVGALRAALNRVIERHEALRTIFPVTGDGRMIQVVTPAQPLPLPVVDVAGTGAEQIAEAGRLVARESARPFDLSNGPVVRGLLLRLAPDDHVLVLVLHHMVADGWSAGVLSRELDALYSAFAAGKPDPFAPLPVQYADYAVWQRQWLAGEVLESQLQYWRDKLTGMPPVLPIPTDRPRPSVPSYQGDIEFFIVPARVAARLRALAHTENATLYMVLLAAFKVLLARYTGQTDVVVGAPIANRRRAELERLIGIFANTLVLRTDCSGDPSFRELLARVRATTLGAFSHQDVPFEQLVEELAPPRDLSRRPLVQVGMQLQNTPQAPWRLGDTDTTMFWSREVTIRTDFEIYLAEIPSDAVLPAEAAARLSPEAAGEVRGGLLGRFLYSRELFDRDTVRRMVGALQAILEATAADPACRLGEFELLSVPERRQITAGTNDTAAAIPDVTIAQLVQRQVTAVPERVALVCGPDRLTFAELGERSSRLAHHLRDLGVTGESVVGLCLERGVDAVIGLLGILQAGGAYLPLDPAFPPARLDFMVADAGASVVVTRAGLAGLVRTGGVHAVLMDADRPAIDRCPAHDPGVRTGLDSLAYVMYTSGSTGRPKGVEVTHRGITNYLAWWATQVGDPADGGVSHHTLAADPSVRDTFFPLISGATLYVLREQEGSFLDALPRLLGPGNRLSFLRVTPSQLMIEMEGRAAAEVAALTPILSVGAEAFPRTPLAEQLADTPGLRLVNQYGPTETTISAAVAWMDGDFVRRSGPVLPIGGPIANTRVYVVDNSDRLVPIGVPGELLIGGAGLARGYRGRPGLTAQRFVPDGFSGVPGARLYRTGDLVRWRADGVLDFLGRRDHQVKVRGYRIELGEIEAVLAGHPQVTSAVVVARTNLPGEQRLVAFVVPAEGGLDLTDLRTCTAAELPAHMVPAQFVEMTDLPLLANGKVDRVALESAPIEPGRYGPAEELVAPRDPVEEVIAGIWADLLGREQVGVLDDFFVLGGHSLMVTRLVSRLRDAFGVEVSFLVVFSSPTVAELAAVVRELTGNRDGVLPPVAPVARDGRLPLSFSQRRLRFLDQMVPDNPFYNLPFSYRIRGHLDVDALRAALDRIVQRHESLRTTFPITEDGKMIQVVAEHRPVPLPTTEVTGDDPVAEVNRLAVAETLRPFDLSGGPVFRGRLFRLSDSDHVLVLVLHHMVADGWSTGVLSRELGVLYAAFSTGEPDPLPPLTVQYGDYAVWQRRWLSGEVLETQLKYWRTKLAGAPTAIDLPADRPRPARPTYAGALRTFLIPAPVATRLRALAQAEHATLYMVLLAAFNVLLARYSGQHDILVGGPVANRRRAELEGLIGSFANTLVLRTDCSGNPSFRELLARVRQTTLGAYTHQDIPFEQLVDELAPPRDFSRNPLVQVMFQLQNTPQSPRSLRGTETSFFLARKPTTHADLEVYLAEIPADADLPPEVAARLPGDDTAVKGGLLGRFGYSTELFDERTADQMARHFVAALRAVAEDAGRPIEDIELLSMTERRQQLARWNDTSSDFPGELTLAALVERQVAATPDAVAVVCGAEQLTYAELDVAANRLAHHLRAAGVGPETVVGLCLERGVRTVVAMLGTLKAGGAYLPLDPVNPPERLGLMMSDAQAPVLVTQRELRARVESPAVVVCLDDDAEEIARHPAEPPVVPGAGPDNLCYVIYTSGSTGRPKGVQIQNRGVVSLLATAAPLYDLGSRDVWTLFHSYAFDLSVWEIWGALGTGGKLVVVPAAVARDPRGVLGLLNEHRVTVFTQTPSVFREIMAGDLGADGPEPATVRLVVFDGEELTPRHVRPWHQRFGHLGARLVNMYGITETTVHVTHHEVDLAAAAAGRRIPIGRPLPNYRTYVLSPSMRPVPVGVAGELYVGGPGVARGYRASAGLTARRFVPDPFGDEPGSRLYRSGDLARALPDGTLEFLGRIDDQVKVHGYRIEPREIETVLSRHPDVATAAVLVREDTPGDRRLVAYIVGGAPVPLSLRDFLAASLPRYMVPAIFVGLETLPLSPNGKVDRRALPSPETVQRQSDPGFVAPEGEVAEGIAAIWADLLGVPAVSAGDDFFELGGHSLNMVSVIYRIHQKFGVRIAFADLFQSSTVAEIAEIVEEARHRDDPDDDERDDQERE